MKKLISLVACGVIIAITTNVSAQDPVVTAWLQNTTQNGTYYVSGNSTPLDNGIKYNCQEVSYSTNYAYIQTHGIPAYTTGPFLDGNPSNAEDQNAIYQFPINPTPAANGQATTGGNIGVFIDGVSLFDYRDGVAWDPSTSAPCGGPGNTPCPGGPQATMDWNRDAVPAEMAGFDCSKGHPANGNYHHHQNPSAFDLDINVISNICNLYDADGLYAIDAAAHSPLIGFAYDGYPIYGAYGYANNDGSGGVVRIRSGYELGTTVDRSTYPDGSASDQGPDFSATYFRGMYREDYIFVTHPEEMYLDEHNGRECVTPEYPLGTYAYFCTVDADWNSAYPYAVGPTFYGEYANRKVNAINEAVTVYEATNSISESEFENLNINVFPNPATDIVAVQIKGLVSDDMTVTLIDLLGKVVATTEIHQGQTIAYFDVATIYSGSYFVKVSNGEFDRTSSIVIQ